MSSSIVYRRGDLNDLSTLTFSPGISATPNTIEFNVVGAGHEFWIAIENNTIVGLCALSSSSTGQRTILYVHVSKSYLDRGLGTGLLRTVIENYPKSDFTVIPFEGTEDFYAKMGFVKVNRWEMRRDSSLVHR
jgi:N-acetylglutamate synthase-like GNAT family acetyltransferase